MEIIGYPTHTTNISRLAGGRGKGRGNMNRMGIVYGGWVGLGWIGEQSIGVLFVLNLVLVPCLLVAATHESSSLCRNNFLHIWAFSLYGSAAAA